MQDLEREWEEFYWVSPERRDCLALVYRHIGQFCSHVGLLQSWTAKVLPMLDDSEPVHSDIDATDDLELPCLKTKEENDFCHLVTIAIHRGATRNLVFFFIFVFFYKSFCM